MSLRERSTGKRRWLKALLVGGLVILAAAGLPSIVGASRAMAYKNFIYDLAPDATLPASVLNMRPPPHDPAKPTAVILLSNQGSNGGDVLGPYQTLAATGAFNLYTVAPERRLVPLTGGLDLVPDLSFAELDQRLDGAAPDVLAVPQLQPAATAQQDAWLSRQARGGALILGICYGVESVASAGLLTGRDATSHWFRTGALEERYPEVRWHRATRYVDNGDIITTGGVLSGIDGALRVIERMLGSDAATAAAGSVGWQHYSPGKPAPLPRSTFELQDTIAGVNLTFRPRPTIGVVITDGIGEIELASFFLTYTEGAYAAHTLALGAGSTNPVRSQHGLVFVPRGDALTATGLDRLVVPGAEAAVRYPATLDARTQDPQPEYPNAQPGFPFDVALRDMARTIDVPTARWRAKLLEYPASELTDVSGPGWPWMATLLPIVYALIGLVVAAALRRGMRSLRRSPTAVVAPETATPGSADGPEPIQRRVPEAAKQ